MVSLAAFFWVLGFVLSVVIAPQLRIWTWGPSMLCMAIASGISIFLISKEEKNKGDFTVILSGFLLVLWMIFRASISDVKELAQSDIFLTCMAISTFVTFRAVGRNPLALRLIQAGLALITIASICLVGRQLTEPGFSPVFPDIKISSVSGFYAHYSYGASFFLTISLIFAGLIFQPGEKVILRCVFGVLAILSAVCVYYTRSRGGIIGLAGGAAVFLLYLLITAKRDNRRWFAPAIIAIPIIIGAIVVALMMWLDDAQQLRGQGSKFSALFDNQIRFNLLTIAVACFQLHPLLGGGARSFSWECFQFWDFESMGPGSNKPEHVHNELLQTLAEYGIIGGVLLLLFLVTVIVVSTFRIISENRKSGSLPKDGWRIGGIAGLAGLFVQSNFEGILRIPPGAILLALCIAAICTPSPARTVSGRPGKPWFVISLLSLAGLFSSVALGYWGLKGTRASIILWDSFFGFTPPSLEAKINAATDAVAIWPLFSLYQHRAILYQQSSLAADDPAYAEELLMLSLKDYKKAASLHPYDPTSVIGVAVLSGTLGRETEAEGEFAKAIQLQGGMEAGFKAHLSFARYLNRKGIRQFSSGKQSEALVTFELAYRHIGKAYETSWTINKDPANPILRIGIMQNYARALEKSGEYRRAIELYDLSLTLPYGASSNYRAAVLYGDLAVKEWSQRNGADALALFLKAKHRLSVTTTLPEDVTEEQRDEWKEYLDQSIGYLKAAKYEPSEKIDF